MNTKDETFIAEKIAKFIKEGKALEGTKENDVTWLKANTLLNNLINVLTTHELIQKYFCQFIKLLKKSIQSDRSLLNGTAIKFLNHCVEKLDNLSKYIEFVPILIRLLRKTNKLYVTRAQDTLVNLLPKINIRLYYNYLDDGIRSNSKIQRIAIYTIIKQIIKNKEQYVKIIEHGIKDPLIEVRNICKELSKKEEKEINPKNKLLKMSSSISQEKLIVKESKENEEKVVITGNNTKFLPKKSIRVKKMNPGALANYFKSLKKNKDVVSNEEVNNSIIEIERYKKDNEDITKKLESIEEYNEDENKGILSFIDETLLYNAEIKSSSDESQKHEIIKDEIANRVIDESDRSMGDRSSISQIECSLLANSYGQEQKNTNSESFEVSVNNIVLCRLPDETIELNQIEVEQLRPKKRISLLNENNPIFSNTQIIQQLDPFKEDSSICRSFMIDNDSLDFNYQQK